MVSKRSARAGMSEMTAVEIFVSRGWKSSRDDARVRDKKIRHVKIMRIYTPFQRQDAMVIGGCTAGPRLFYTSRLSARRDPRQSGTAPWTRDDAGSATRDTTRSLQRTPSQLPARLPHYGSPHTLPSFLAQRCTNWYHYVTSKYVYGLCVYCSRNMNDGVSYPIVRNNRSTTALWLLVFRLFHQVSAFRLFHQVSAFARFLKLD